MYPEYSEEPTEGPRDDGSGKAKGVDSLLPPNPKERILRKMGVILQKGNATIGSVARQGYNLQGDTGLYLRYWHV